MPRRADRKEGTGLTVCGHCCTNSTTFYPWTAVKRENHLLNCLSQLQLGYVQATSLNPTEFIHSCKILSWVNNGASIQNFSFCLYLKAFTTNLIQKLLKVNNVQNPDLKSTCFQSFWRTLFQYSKHLAAIQVWHVHVLKLAVLQFPGRMLCCCLSCFSITNYDSFIFLIIRLSCLLNAIRFALTVFVDRLRSASSMVHG